jgi:hypothetical protein
MPAASKTCIKGEQATVITPAPFKMNLEESLPDEKQSSHLRRLESQILLKHAKELWLNGNYLLQNLESLAEK